MFTPPTEAATAHPILGGTGRTDTADTAGAAPGPTMTGPQAGGVWGQAIRVQPMCRRRVPSTDHLRHYRQAHCCAKHIRPAIWSAAR
jgi:hypothetical protein